MIRTSKTIGRNYVVHENDVKVIKEALRSVGYYKVPEYGMTPYPDEKMFDSIRTFQKDNDLKVDGIVHPDGETLDALNREIYGDDPAVKSPTIWCPKCGGSHGGSKGDLCPDCDVKT